MLVMEWIDGLDLRMLLSKERMLRVQKQVSEKRWNRINDHILTTTKTSRVSVPELPSQSYANTQCSRSFTSAWYRPWGHKTRKYHDQAKWGFENH